LILASQSPRRAELLAGAGYQFEVAAPQLDEPARHDDALPAALQAEARSYFKASAVAAFAPAAVILGADTVVALGDRIFGKAKDADDARRILSALAGTTHDVITGVTVVDTGTGRRRIAHDVTHVRMRPVSADQLEDYLGSRTWQGKAGAYGIQDRDDPFVEAIEGSFSNVVGLPMELVVKLLGDFACRPGGPPHPQPPAR
jgi:septum formation protein